MSFNAEYEKIIECIEPELKEFRLFVQNSFHSENKIENLLKAYLNKNGKLIRPALIFLFTKAYNIEISDVHFHLAYCDEMIHNASLIHDDIIDESCTRRGAKTLNSEYSARLAVIAGDYLLAQAIESLSSINNNTVITVHSNYIKKLISGEVNQYFSEYEIPSIKDYIEKSKSKTASLFQAGLESAAILNKTSSTLFAENFGIAFQIHNDLTNFSSKRGFSDDINHGVYTAPVIFGVEFLNMSKFNNIDELYKPPVYGYCMEKTARLIKEYTDLAIENISDLEDNQYKQAIIDLCNLYAKG